MKHILIVKEDQQVGELGLLLKGVPYNPDLFMCAREGRLIAHDIIEHVNGLKSIGTIHDEMQALGAIYYVRGQFDDLVRPNRGYHTPQASIAGDFSRMYGELSIAEFIPCKQKTMPHEFDWAFEEIKEIALKEIINEASSDEQDKEALKELLPAYESSIIPYMRIGARKAAKRYKNNAGNANHMFWNICEAVDKIVNQIEYEGQQFRLEYNDSYGARCFDIEEDY